MRRFDYLFWLLFIIPQALSAAAADTVGPAFWKVTAESGQAYLLGSVHFGSDDLYPLPPAIMDAYEKADALVVEANLLQLELREGARMLLAGIYQDGSTLKDKVRPSTWQALEAAASRHHLPMEFFQVQKPWFAALMLISLEFQRAGYRETWGVDQFFLEQAAGSKPIIELESIAWQLGLFNQLSEDEQELFLVQTLQDIAKGGEYLTSVIDAWKIGDLGKIDALMNESLRDDPGSERIYRLFVTERNIAMAGRLEDLLAQGGTYFVVVGAGHVVGEQGIIELLKASGYKVERL